MTVIVWVAGGVLGAAAAVIVAWVGLCWWFGDRDLFKRQYPKHPGPRTPVRGLGLDPGGGDDGPVPRREPAAGSLDQFADDIRKGVRVVNTTGLPDGYVPPSAALSPPDPYDHYNQRHPKRPVADPDPRAVRQRDPNLRDGPARR